MAHVAQAKKTAVADFKKYVKDYPIIGVVNVENLPTAQLNTMRRSLRDEDVVIKLTKKRLLRIVLSEMDASKKGVSSLTAQMKGMPALIFAKGNSFKLYKKIQSKKSSAPAKAGQHAPRDITVSAGPTPFAPGPVISELAQLKIKAGIENGKVVIKQDCVVVKEGDVISAPLASMLARLSIFPMEIGLDVVALYENGTVYNRDILGVDEKQYLADLTSAHNYAFNLAVECQIFTKETTEFFLGQAHSQARSLAIAQAIPEAEVIADILAKAQGHASSLDASLQR